MEPINKKERQSSIWAFLGVWVITVIPLCFLVYELSRVDAAENKHLREQVKLSDEEIIESDELRESSSKLSESISNLGSFLGEKKAVPHVANHYADLASHLDEIEKLMDEHSDIASEGTLGEHVGMMDQMHKCLFNFTEMYKILYKELESAEAELSEHQ